MASSWRVRKLLEQARHAITANSNSKPNAAAKLPNMMCAIKGAAASSPHQQLLRKQMLNAAAVVAVPKPSDLSNFSSSSIDAVLKMQQTAQSRMVNALMDVEFFPGSQAYFKTVAESIESNFSGDARIRELIGSVTWQDMALTAFNVAKYRELRRARGQLRAPPPATTTSTTSVLCPSDFAEWAFFAKAAYEEDDRALRTLLMKRNHQLVFHEYHVGVFQPAHFLSMSLDDDESENGGGGLVVIGIKGTSSINDWLTNLFISKEEMKINDESSTIDSGIHAGVLQAARFVLDRVGALLQRAFYKSGFRVVVVGHSLGAGVASALTMLLREELKMERVQCYAFAPPPSVSRDLAARSQDYVFSVVNGDDAIPRTGVAQLKNLALGIRRVADFKAQHGGDWRQVERALDATPWDDLVERHANEYVEKQFDTYVPGRILYLHEDGGGGDAQEDAGSVTAVEVACDVSGLRVAMISPTMAVDHSMDAYLDRLQRAASTSSSQPQQSK